MKLPSLYTTGPPGQLKNENPHKKIYIYPSTSQAKYANYTKYPLKFWAHGLFSLPKIPLPGIFQG